MWVRGNKPEVAPTKVPSAIDIAWSAGIYEGEGCCRNCGKGKRGFMTSVGQNHPELLYRLRDWFGGTVRLARKEPEFYQWDVCGDLARIFISSIYVYMTARRKSQIDSTEVLDFLGSASPVGLSIIEIRSALDVYYEQERLVKAEKAIAYRLDKYKNDSVDPDWSQKTNEYNAKLRANWTQEQREASRKYQREYKRKKKQQLLNVVEMRKTA